MSATCKFDVYVKENRLESVQSKFSSVSELFEVVIGNGSQSGKQFMPTPGRWFTIHGVREQAVKAREYVKGLADPEEVVRLTFPSICFEDLSGQNGEKKCALEKDTAANIIFHSKTEVEISGCISCVTRATSYLESTIHMLVGNHNNEDDEDTNNDIDHGNNNELTRQHSIDYGINDTDSVTDSGFAEDGKSHSGEQRLSGIIIDDSEESLEDDQQHQKTNHLCNRHCYCPHNISDDDDDSESQHQNYQPNTTNVSTKIASPNGIQETTCGGDHTSTEKTFIKPHVLTVSKKTIDNELMDYALKLGYNQQQVISAMQKIDTINVDQNQLLLELIKGSTSDKLIGKTSSLLPQQQHQNENEKTDTGNNLRCTESSNLRHIVIDGSNVAMSHGKNLVFSCRGIRIAVDWFRKRSHVVTVFVPNWRKETARAESPIIDQKILSQLEEEGVLSFTPSRRINGRLVQCYDDRYIVRLAFDQDGVIVSNDHFRDLHKECPEWREFIENRLLMYTFANGDLFMPPDDPLGRNGPTLDEFLQRNPETRVRHCPYGKKCTFGPRCKFFHPERSSPHPPAIKNKLPISAQHLNHLQQSGSRPRSDPGQNMSQGGDSRQRPNSLPNLEQLYVSPQQVAGYMQQYHPHPHGRPLSGPPFPEMQLQHPDLNARGRSLSEFHIQQQHPHKQHQLSQRMMGGDFQLYSKPSITPPFHQLRPNRRKQNNDMNGRPRSCCDYIGRPLSSDFSSRPSSGDYSFNGGSRPGSGDYSQSRPNSGDYTGLPWHISNGIQPYQRPVTYPQAVHSNQIAYVDTRNFYPVKGYHKSRTPTVMESKEEKPPNVLRIELVEQLRQIFPDQYDRILNILRSHPNITALDEAIQYMNE